MMGPWTARGVFSTLNGCGSYLQSLGISAYYSVGMDDAVELPSARARTRGR